MGWWKEEQQRRFLVQVVHRDSGEHLKLDCQCHSQATLLPSGDRRKPLGRRVLSGWQWTGYYHFGNLGFSVLG